MNIKKETKGANRRTTVLLIVVVLAVASSSAARDALAAEPLEFALPGGFVDRTREGAAALAPMLESMGLSHTRPVVIGADATGGRLRALMIGAITDGNADDIVLPSPSELEHQTRMAAISQGVTLSKREVSRITVGGVRAIRMIAEGPDDGIDSHREVCFVPGETQMGIVTYVASRTDAATYAPRFAAAIEKTKGLHAVPWWRFKFEGIKDADIGKMVGLMFVLVVGYFVFAARKRRR